MNKRTKTHSQNDTPFSLRLRSHAVSIRQHLLIHLYTVHLQILSTLISNIPNLDVAADSSKDQNASISREIGRRDQGATILGANDGARGRVHDVEAFLGPARDVAAVRGDAQGPALAGPRAGEAVRGQLAVLRHPDVHDGAPDGDDGGAVGGDGQGTRVLGRLHLELVERLACARVRDAESAIPREADQR